MKINNNKILITGATEGIGRALAMKLAELNNTVIAVARNESRLDELSRISSRIIPLKYDISKLDDLKRLSVEVGNQHSDLNILINNAGVQYNYDFTEELDLLPKIDYEVNVNLLAPLRLIGLMIPILQLNDNAAIVNVSSGLGLVPKMDAPVYCGTKAAIHIFSKSLRYQLNKIKVFEIIPPLVDTNMTKGRGSGKIHPDRLVQEFIKCFSEDRFEISVGKVKLLKLVNRLIPVLAEKIMKNGR